MGGNATPPPAHCGALVVPWRALPVPFCRQGLRDPPATAERPLAEPVPRRRLASWARMAACTATSFYHTVKDGGREVALTVARTIGLEVGCPVHGHHLVMRM